MDLKILDPIKGIKRFQKCNVNEISKVVHHLPQKFQTNELPSSTVGQKRRRKLGTVTRILSSYVPVCVKCSVV